MYFKNILVPYDESEHARSALHIALGLAGPYPEAKVHVMTVIPSSSLPDPTLMAGALETPYAMVDPSSYERIMQSVAENACADAQQLIEQTRRQSGRFAVAVAEVGGFHRLPPQKFPILPVGTHRIEKVGERDDLLVEAEPFHREQGIDVDGQTGQRHAVRIVSGATGTVVAAALRAAGQGRREERTGVDPAPCRSCPGDDFKHLPERGFHIVQAPIELSNSGLKIALDAIKDVFRIVRYRHLFLRALNAFGTCL